MSSDQKPQPITSQIYDYALMMLEKQPQGMRWVDLNLAIKARFPKFHPKTINGCIWKLVEKYPDQVHKPSRGLFQLTKYKKAR